MVGPVAQPNLVERFERSAAPFGTLHAGINEGQLNIAESRHSGYEVEALKDEPDLFVANAREGVFVESFYVITRERVGARGGNIQAPQKVHER
jgi:hypothetical protein